MTALLDETMRGLQKGETVDVPMHQLIEDLYLSRKKNSESDWRNWIAGDFRSHQVYPLLLEDPFVHHSTVRPRGYPGDAELLEPAGKRRFAGNCSRVTTNVLAPGSSFAG